MKTKIVALWIYTGNSLNGHDCPRYGDFELACAANAYHRYVNDERVVQRIAPSKAHCKPEKSNFGFVVAYRVLDPEKVLAWYKSIPG